MENREFEKGSAMLFILIMTSNVLNGLFQILLGKLLNNVELYGLMSALISFLNIASLPVAFISLVITKYTAELNIKNEQGRIKAFLRVLLKYVIVCAGIVAIVGAILTPLVGKYLKISELPLIILILFGAVITYIMQIPIGYFQGSKNFISYGIYNLISPVAKSILCILFAMAGFKLYGVAFSILLANIITVVIGLFWLKKIFKNIKLESIDIGKKNIIKFSFSTIMMNIGYTFLYNIDMILMKHYFVDEVGYYSVASVLGKIILYFVSVIVVTLFPYAVERKSEVNAANNLLKKVLGYGIVISLFVAAMLNLASNMIIIIMYNTTYLEAEKYIFPVSIFIIGLSILTIISNYDLACGSAKFVTVTMFGMVISSIILISIWHEDILQVIWTLVVTISIASIINIIKIYNKINKNKIKNNQKI